MRIVQLQERLPPRQREGQQFRQPPADPRRVLELRRRLQALPAGGAFHLRASDAGAPEDIPSWCRLTGNVLVRAAPPDYWIRRKD